MDAAADALELLARFDAELGRFGREQHSLRILTSSSVRRCPGVSRELAEVRRELAAIHRDLSRIRRRLDLAGA